MALNGRHELHEEHRLQAHITDQRFLLIDSKLDTLLVKVDTLSVTMKSTPRTTIDWTKILDNLGIKLTVLIMLLLGNVKLLDAVNLILKRN